MSFIQVRKRYSFDVIQNELEQIEQKSKSIIFLFEISTLKNNQKFNKALSSLNEQKELVDSYSSKIKGFNYWGALIGFAITHYFMLVQKRRLLYELNPKQILLHLGISSGIGIANGFVLGNTFGYSFRLYNKYSKIHNNLHRLTEEFISAYNPETVLKPAH